MGIGAASPFREEMERFPQNDITKVAFRRIGDPEVIPLWFGEGDLATPAFIRDAAKAALDAERTFYVHTRGIAALRAAIKTYLDRLYGLDLNPDRISVPGSAMLGINIAAQMALARGDHGLILSPVWPNIEAVFRVAGAEIGHVRQRLTEGGWRLDLEEIIAATRPGTKAIFVNSPCNPTGWIMQREEQEALLEFCRARGILVIADEVYHRTVFDGDRAPSFLEIARDEDPLVVVNSFSKGWAMTGWRLGWVVAPARHATQWAALSECHNTGASAFAQYGGIAALERGEPLIRRLQAQYRAGRDIVDAALAGHPLLRHSSPAGAFYAFPEIPKLQDSLAFAHQLLDEENLGLAPGSAFGPGNDSHVRLCFAQSHEKLKEGLARLVRFTERQFG